MLGHIFWGYPLKNRPEKWALYMVDTSADCWETIFRHLLAKVPNVAERLAASLGSLAEAAIGFGLNTIDQHIRWVNGG